MENGVSAIVRLLGTRRLDPGSIPLGEKNFFWVQHELFPGYSSDRITSIINQLAYHLMQ